MRPPLDLGRLRRRGRLPWVALVVSGAAHAALLLFGSVDGRMPQVPHRPPQLIVLAPPAEGPPEVPMRFRPSGPPAGQRSRGVAPTPAPSRPEPETPVVVRPPVERPRTETVDTGTTQLEERPPAIIGLIGPGLAEGRLWVRPLPLPPKELAERLTQERHVALVDSAVNAIVQSYLDSIAADPSSRKTGLPSWTTNVAGTKFGLDSSNIYFAGLKIPAVVLALLPLPGSGNVDQNRAYNHLMSMRADLQYAAQRSQNLQDFKDMIRDMRLRKEREEEFERNQRTAPPPEEPPTP